MYNKDKKNKKNIKEIIDEMYGLTPENYDESIAESTRIARIVDLVETVEILKEVFRWKSFKEWWDSNAIDGVIVYWDAKEIVIPTKIEVELSLYKLRKLGIFAAEFGFIIVSDREEML